MCTESKPLEEYHNSKSFPLGKAYTCKACSKARSKIWNTQNKERKKKTGQLHYQENKDVYLERARTLNWIKKNPERNKELKSLWAKNNRGKRASYVAKRRACKLQATPPWLTKAQLQDITDVYQKCVEVSRLTNEVHHVDHIVPLQGKNVCGLHVAWNLEVIPASMNISKSNKFNSNWIW